MSWDIFSKSKIQYFLEKLKGKFVQKETGKGLSTNDYDNTDKAKVDKIDTTTTSISGNPISISGLKANQLAKNPIITLEPIQAGSGTPSPVNQRPISGYDKIEVLSCGKNIWLNGNVSGTTFASIDLPYALEPGTYTLSAIVTSSDTDAQGCLLYDTTNNTNLGSITRSSARTSKSFTITQKCKQLTFYASTAYQYSIGDTFSFVDIQIEKGSSATSYEPPVKTTDLSESLGQTVYGLTHEVRTGKARSYLKTLDMANMDWQYSSGLGKFYCYLGDLQLMGDLYCTYYKPIKTIIDDSEDYIITSQYNYYLANSGVVLKDTRYTDATSLKASLTGQLLLYTVGTPTEIQLTPHEISLLKDYAYVSTNGTNIALDYHNGELASLADVSQLGETVNELVEYVNTINDNEYVDCNNCSTIASIFDTIKQGQALKSISYGVGYIGNSQNTNIKTLLGNPSIANYVDVYIKPIATATYVQLAEVFAIGTVNVQTPIKRKYIWTNQNMASQSAWETINYMT